jgi:hypothetical protein
MTSDLYDRAQTAVLELFGVDNVDDITPAQRLRVEIATALKVLFDGQQNQILDGKNVDPLKLISTIDALVKLAPAPPPQPQQDRRHIGGRERLAQLIGDTSAWEAEEQVERAAMVQGLQDEITRLTDENRALRQQMATGQQVREPAAELIPPPPRQLPPPEQPQPVGTAAAHANQPGPPRHWLKSGQPREGWEDHFLPAPGTGRPWFGPV